MAVFMRSRTAFCRVLFAVSRTRNVSKLTNLVKDNSKRLVDNISARDFRHFSTSVTANQVLARAQAQNVVNMESSNIDQALHNLDREVRRVGRVRKDMVVDIIEKIIAEKKIGGHQSLVLLRSLGSLMVDEAPAERTLMVHQLWDIMVKLDSTRDIMHYNALMKAHIQNSYGFSATDMLADIHAAGLSPNRVTFQRLIDRYCQEGDVNGAKQILGHMKSEGVPINELVFNALIMGHMRDNDETSAKGILKIMRDAGIAPSADTFTVLMREYARQGNVNAALDTASTSGVSFHPSHYLDVIVTLCDAGHGQHTSAVLLKCPRTLGYNQDCMNGALQLVARQHETAALTVFQAMNHPQLADTAEDIAHARFLLKAIIKRGTTLPKITAIMKDLADKRLSSDGSDFVAKWALIYEKPELAAACLQLMSEEGKPVRTHYFWPLFITMKKAKDKEGIYNVLTLSEKLVDKSSDFIFTLHEYVIPSLLELGDNRAVIKQRLQAIGIHHEDTQFAFLIHLLRSGQEDEAAKLLTEGSIRINHAVLVPQIREAVSRKSVSIDNIVQILSAAKSSPVVALRFHPAEINGNALIDLITIRRMSEEESTSVVKKFIDHKLGVAPLQFDTVAKFLSSKKVLDELIEKLLAIDVAELTIAQTRRAQYVESGEKMSDKSSEELEKLLENDPNSILVKKWLLYKSCMDGKIERADEIKKELETKGFVFMGDMLRNLWHLAAFHKRDLTESLAYQKKLERDFPDYALYPSCVLHTACLLAENGDLTGVLNSLDDYHRRHQAHMKDRNYAEEYKLEGNCARLIKSVQDGGNLAGSRQVLEKLFELGYTKKGTYSLLKQYITGFIDKGDLGGVVDAMKLMTENYERSPEYHQVFRMLIEREDSENLQKVMDMVSVNFGEMQALHHLVNALIQCGQVEKARKVMETPGVRALMDVLDATCNLYINQNKIKELEALVDVTKGIFGLDREMMLFYLIKGYSRAGDIVKAQETFTLFEEENVNPRARTLRYLAKVLQSYDLPVPFDVPEFTARVETESAGESRFTAVEQAALEKAATGSVPDLTHLRESCGGTLPAAFLQELAKVIYSTRKPGSLKYMVFELASTGDLASLQVLKDMNMNVFNKGLIHSAIFRAYLESNRPDECIALLERDEKNIGKYLNSKTMLLFQQNYPAQFPKFEDLCMKTSQAGNDIVAIQLWNSAVLANEFDKSDNLIKRFPGIMDKIRVATVCIEAKNNNDEAKLNYIINACRDNAESSAFAYSYLLGLHAANENCDAALDVLERVRSRGLTMAQLRPQALASLEEVLVKHGKNVPWPRGQFSSLPSRSQGFANRPQNASSSSSSSSSDSDSDEEVRKQTT